LLSHIVFKKKKTMIKLNKKICKGLALICLILGANLHTFATTYTLNISNAQTQWSDANAWQPNGVPGAGDDVIINGDAASSLIIALLKAVVLTSILRQIPSPTTCVFRWIYRTRWIKSKW
jgi:hypothetical protein